ncbi:MAG: S41 family peptidase [Chloroflexota bacterium]
MQPIDYLEQAVQLIETHSYYQPSIEKWTQHKASVFAQLTSATTLDDVHHLIRDLLYTLGDNHSHLLPPNWQTNPQKTAQNLPTARKIASWGYIHLPQVVGDDASMLTYANTIAQHITKLMPVSGWVIDLRDNTGGNMWAMLAGIGAIAGAGVLGSFIDRDGMRVDWGYEAGASMYDGEAVYTISEPNGFDTLSQPVAVLIGERTASSGELTLVSFLGRLRTRTFGQATRGVPTANDIYPLADGARLVLTQFVSADRQHRTYYSPILPDVICDDALTTATTWLSTQ